MSAATTIVSADYVQGSFGLLPRAGERARASLYFARILGSKSFDGEFEVARRYLRASLSEFRSIFDLINVDLKAEGLKSKWDKSLQLGYLNAEPIVSVLRKVRDFAIHLETIRGSEKIFKVSGPNLESPVSEMSTIVIEPLSKSNPEMARNISHFSTETIETFNEIVKRWPADLVIQAAVYRASQPLAMFLKQEHKAS